MLLFVLLILNVLVDKYCLCSSITIYNIGTAV